MDTDLLLLDEKISRLIELLEAAREHNGALRNRLEVAEARCQQLESQMDAARDRLELLVKHLPDPVELA